VGSKEKNSPREENRAVKKFLQDIKGETLKSMGGGGGCGHPLKSKKGCSRKEERKIWDHLSKTQMVEKCEGGKRG